MVRKTTVWTIQATKQNLTRETTASELTISKQEMTRHNKIADVD